VVGFGVSSFLDFPLTATFCSFLNLEIEFFKSFIKSALEPLKLISSTTFILYLLNAFFSFSEISTEYSLLGSLTITTSLTPTSLKIYAN